MKIDTKTMKWTRQPQNFSVSENIIEITTEPHTDLWQRTYYNFRNDNAPVLQLETSEQYFSFTVKAQSNSKHRFDQCGVVVYLDSDNWMKASMEYENEQFQHLGSVVTNNGYSDWATTEMSADIKSICYRLSRREQDFRIEWSDDGERYQLMRIFHLFNAKETVQFGVYACSPEQSTFTATFTEPDFGECIWADHDGQQPD